MPKQALEYYDVTVGPTRSKTMVCVTDQRRCDRIIKAGKMLAEMTDTELAVINIAHPERIQDPDSIEYLFRVSREKNAEMTVLYSKDVAKAMIRYIKENKVAYLLTGIPQEGDSIITKVWSKFTHVTFFVVEENGELREVTHPVRAARALVEAACTES
ncbi:MAG: hypothetical protein RR320_01140 [Oscillospiraceae bacterium]